MNGERSLLIASPKSQGWESSTFGTIESSQTGDGEPLELQDDDSFHTCASNNDGVRSKSSLSQATVNIVKMCIGTGVLAIPFAATEGGLIFHILGTGLLFLWNYHSVKLLIQSEQCIDLGLKKEAMASFSHLESQDSLSTSTSTTDSCIRTTEHQVGPQQSTFSKIAAEAFGSTGMHAVDCSMIFLMFGIIIAYEDAVLGFMEQTEISTGSVRMDALCLIIVMIPILLLPSYESAAKISALGNWLIFIVFSVIGYYGIQANGLDGFHKLTSQSSISMWPRSIASFSKWFGIVVFSNGIVPFTYELKESIEEPRLMMVATRRSSWIVFVTYSLIGCIISLVFVSGIQSDVISCLPQVGFLPAIIRISMAIVVLTSLPLTIIPLGMLIHSKVTAILNTADAPQGANEAFASRLIMASICATISVEVPNFVYVVSFIGCFCVAFISFVYPPMLHITSIYKFCSVEDRMSKTRLLIYDIVLIVLGLIVVALTSVLTFLGMIEQIQNKR